MVMNVLAKHISDPSVRFSVGGAILSGINMTTGQLQQPVQNIQSASQRAKARRLFDQLNRFFFK
jgi:hypothetical protein